MGCVAAMALRSVVIHFFTEDDAYITEEVLTNPPPAQTSWRLQDRWWETVDIIDPSQYGEGPDVWKIVIVPRLN